MKKHPDLSDEMFRFLGIFIAGIVVFLIVAGLLYALVGSLSPTGIHLLATGEAFVILIAYWLGHREGRAHREGLEHGVDLRVNAAQRRTTLTAPDVQRSGSPSTQYNALLPTVDQRATIITRPDNDTTVVEM